jgi:hypothetical protein
MGLNRLAGLMADYRGLPHLPFREILLLKNN